MRRKVIKYIGCIIMAAALLCAYAGVSTDDYYTMELRQAVPEYVTMLEIGGLIGAIPGIILIQLESWF